MKRVFVFLVVFLFLLGTSLSIGAPEKTPKGFYVKQMQDLTDKPTVSQDRIVVKFKAAIRAQDVNIFAQKFGLKKVKDSYKPGMFTVFQHSAPDSVLAALKADPGVEYAERDGIAYANSQVGVTGVPSDPLFPGYQWNFKDIQTILAWDLYTGTGVTVAVVDTGVYQALADFANTSFVPGYNFCVGSTNTNDNRGHGSHVAGTIAASTWDGYGCAGIAYNASIMPVKVLNRFGWGYYSWIADGIVFAADNGAQVINMSLGGVTDNTALEDAVKYAYAAGCVIVTAAGNYGWSLPFYPAYYDECIAVSATWYQDQKANYSNFGDWVDIAAPGGQYDYFYYGPYYMILQETVSVGWYYNPAYGYNYSPYFGYWPVYFPGFWWYQGTSMSSPHVSGVAALMLSKNSGLSNVEVANILYSSADNVGSSWHFGNGRVNALSALNATPYATTPTGWRKFYGGYWDESCWRFSDVEQTSDGGYVVTSSTDSFTNGSYDCIIYKLDASGNKEWRKNYGGKSWEDAHAVTQTSDGGYVMAGYSDSFTYGGGDFLVYKLHANGNKEWRRNYGGTAYDEGYGIAQTADGGYFLAGGSWSFSYGQDDFLIYKLNSDGIKQWRKNFGGTNSDWCYALALTSDGGCVLAGESYSFSYGSADFLVYKLDASGNKQWRKNFGGINWDQCNEVIQTSDGGYFLIGTSTSFTYGSNDILVYKLDASGNKVWRKNFGGIASDWGYGVAQTPDGGYVLCGTTSSFTHPVTGASQAVIYKLDALGNKEWRKTYGGYDYDTFRRIATTADGLVAAGYTYSYGIGGVYGYWNSSDIAVYKMDANGNWE